MKTIIGAMLACCLVFAALGAARAACSPSEVAAAQVIYDNATAYSGPPPVWVVGDSHTVRMGTAAPVNFQVGGVPILFAGVAGATISDVADCYPLQAIADTNPAAIIFVMGFNDADQSLCCDPTAPHAQTAAHAGLVAATVSLIKTSFPTAEIIIANDPAQSTSATVAQAYKVYSVAKSMRSVAAANVLTFVDLYQTAPFTICYVPYPYCQVPVTAFVDPYHYQPQYYRLILDQLLLAAGMNSSL